jgi:hypothetical protein
MDKPMKKLLATLAVSIALIAPAAAQSSAHDASRFTGVWYSVDQDTRTFTIKRTSNGLKMTGPDLECTIKHLDVHPDDTANGLSECFDEGSASRGTWLLKLFDNGYLAVVEHLTEASQMNDDGSSGQWKKANTTHVYVYSRRNEHAND